MALNATQSVDILFKKFVTSKATTTTSKQYFEEGYTSVPNVLNNNIWLQSDEIPNTATTSSVTQFISVTMSYISGSNGAFYDPTGTLTDIIPFGYGDGSSYNYQIFRNNGITTISSGQSDWFFDNNSGILTFFSGTLTSGTIVDGGSGQTLATAQLPPIAKVWKYVGKKGSVPNLNGLTYSGGTMSINIGTGLTFSNGQLTVSGSVGTYSGGLTISNGIVTTTVGNGLTNSNNSLSIIVSDGLTFSNSQLALNIGTGLTFSSGQLQSTSVTTVSNGLTANGTTYSVNINTNGLTFSSGQLALNIGSGLTYNSGVLQTVINVSPGNGLTSSGNTFSLLLQSNSGLTVSSSGISLASNINGTGLTFTNGQLSLTNPIYFTNGITNSGNTYSVNINSNGLTFSSGQLALNIGSGLTYNSGVLQTVINVSPGNGLTSSGNTFSLLLQSNSGLTVSSSGISLASNINGTGLTFTNGQLSLTNPIYFTNGITNSGNTYSVNINSNGLTFSSGQLGLNIGTGLTFSSGKLQSTSVTTVGNGLTANGNTYSVNINSNGLTFSNSQLSLNIGTGLTFSNGQLQSTSVTTVGNGLTANGNTYSVNINTNGLTFSNGQLALNIGNGLTFSNGQLQSTSVTTVGNGLTDSGNTYSVNVDPTSGLTFSGSGQLTMLYNNPEAMITTVGAWGVGTTFSNVPLIQVLDGILYPYVAPTLSLSLSTSTLDFGNTQSVTVTWSVTKKKNNINGGTLSSPSMTSLTLSGLQLTSGGSTVSYPVLNTNTTWTLLVSDYNGSSGSPVNSKTTTLSFSNRIFWGNIPSSNTLSTVGSGTFSYTDLNSIGVSNEFGSTFVGLNKTIASNGGYVAFIFPHSTFDMSIAGKVKLNNVTIDNNWVKVRDNVQFTNQYGYTGTNYDVWRYGATQSSTNVTYYISA